MSIVNDDGLERFATVRLTSDLRGLTVNERAMIPILIDAAERMDEIYWLEMCGPRESELNLISDPRMRRRVEINFGPWDRMDADRPFVPGVGERPKGARFYPIDMTIDEFNAATDQVSGEPLRSLYTLVQRDAGVSWKRSPITWRSSTRCAPPRRCYEMRRPWRMTTASGGTSSSVRPLSRPTITGRATMRGWT